MVTQDKLHNLLGGRTNKQNIAILMTEVKTDGRPWLNSDGHMRGDGWKTERSYTVELLLIRQYFIFISYQVSIPPLILIISIQFSFAISMQLDLS